MEQDNVNYLIKVSFKFLGECISFMVNNYQIFVNCVIF